MSFTNVSAMPFNSTMAGTYCYCFDSQTVIMRQRVLYFTSTVLQSLLMNSRLNPDLKWIMKETHSFDYGF